MSAKEGPIPHSEILQLKRWNTPTIYNGWEQLTKMDITDGTKPVLLLLHGVEGRQTARGRHFTDG